MSSQQKSPAAPIAVEAPAITTTIATDNNNNAEEDALTKGWNALRQSFHSRNWFWFCLLGFINNYHYCVVISGAQSLAESFHLKNLMALISWANIAGGVFVRFINAFILMHWSYNKKYLCAGIQTLFGVVVVCLAPLIGTNDGFKFFLTLFGILFIGNGSNFGEQTSLGFMDQFPSLTIGGWSSGTGISGVAGALVYLGLQNANLNESSIFAIQIPFIFVYWLAYYWGIILVPKKEVTLVINEQGNGDSINNLNNNNTVSFKKLLNYERSWADDVVLGSSSSSTTTTHSNNSSTSSRELANNGAKFGERTENVPLLNEENNDNVDAQQQHQPGNAMSPKQDEDNKYTDEEDEQKDDGDLTPVGENPEWGSFRRWLFRVAPVFPAEAIVECNRLILFQGVNLFLVYIFEYSIQFAAPNCFPDFPKNNDDNNNNNNNNYSYNVTSTSTTIISTTSSSSSAPPPPTTTTTICSPKSDFDFMTRNAYVISQFCYQIGVLISRSSLSVVRIHRVEFLTLFQFVNFVCWIVLAKTGWLVDDCDAHRQLHFTIIMMLWMVLVGLQGGASYVNVFYNILSDVGLQEKLAAIAKGELKRQKDRKRKEEKRLGQEQPQLTPFKLNARELTMNVSALYQTVGITLGSLLDVILDNTLFKK